MKDENSVERISRMVKDVDKEIAFLHDYELKTAKHVEELTEQLENATQELKDIRDKKMDALSVRMAFVKFIKSGGGLDTFVD